MSDTSVRPLILEMSDPFARRLLESGRVDGPEPGARDRALLGLGLAPIGLLALVPAPAAAATATPASALLAHGRALPWLLGKSLAIGLVASVVTLTVVDGVLPRSGHAPAGPAFRPASSAAAPPPHRAAAVEAVPSTSPEPVAPTTALADSTSSLPSNAAGKPPSPSRPSLGSSPTAPSAPPYSETKQMLDALARVRRALPREAARAIALLDDFEQRYPASPLAEEAVVLRIEALNALGRVSEAQTLASRFLRDAPASIYRARVRALM
jgi:hypothetical protein